MPIAPLLLRTVAVGTGATVFMDVAGLLRQRIWGVPPLDLGLLGRWVGHLARGRLRHDTIRDAEPIVGEMRLGWAAHYLIGIGFASLLTTDHRWSNRPTACPALLVGLGTTLAPWLVLQPAFGMGVAASKTPEPGRARTNSLLAHTAYGVGLYLAGLVVSCAAGGARRRGR